MRTTLIALITLAEIVACRPRSGQSAILGLDETAVRTKLDQAAFQSFGGGAEQTKTVKFTFRLSDNRNPLLFQNTQRFPFHNDFFNSPANTVWQDLKNLNSDAYQKRIFPPHWDTIGGGIVRRNPTSTQPVEFGIQPYVINGIDPETGRPPELSMVIIENIDTIKRAFDTISKSIKGVSAIAVPIDDVIVLEAFFSSMDEYKNIRVVDSALFAGSANATKDQTVYVQRHDQKPVYGIVRVFPSPATFEASGYSHRDIIVTPHVPFDIGPTSAFITGQEQSAHAHIIFRAQSFNIIDAYVKDASTELARWNGKAVELSSINGELKFKEVTAKVVQDWHAAQQIKRLATLGEIPLGADQGSKQPFVWSKNAAPNAQFPQYYGAKASNFGILNRAIRMQLPNSSAAFDGSFMVPFRFYEKHLKQAIRAEVCTTAKSKIQNQAKKETAAYGKSSIANWKLDQAVAKCQVLATAGRTLETLVLAMLAERNSMYEDVNLMRGWLGIMREVVARNKMDPSDLNLIEQQIGSKFAANQRMRFRSSTNAEDLPGLNGAGLYTSKAGCLADKGNKVKGPSACTIATATELNRINQKISEVELLIKAAAAKEHPQHSNLGDLRSLLADLQGDLTDKDEVEDGISKVFASLWNERAFRTREFFGIDHMKVRMGLLVHPSFVDESANGVGLIRKSGKGYELDLAVQVLDYAVTNPIAAFAKADRLSFTSDASGKVITQIEYSQRSNLLQKIGRTEGSSSTSVLTQGQIEELAKQMIIAYDALKTAYGKSYQAVEWLDVEFKSDAKGHMLLKQARPYAAENH